MDETPRNPRRRGRAVRRPRYEEEFVQFADDDDDNDEEFQPEAHDRHVEHQERRPIHQHGATKTTAPMTAHRHGTQDPTTGKKRKPSSSSLKPTLKEPPRKRIDAHGRVVRWSSQPSQKVLDRIARAMPHSGHRLFLIDRKPVGMISSDPSAAGESPTLPSSSSSAGGGATPRAEEFAVLGATGNVYTVTIGPSPQCTCPDAAKGNVCKHHLFVMLRVLKVPQHDPIVWQRGLLPHEVEKILSKAVRSTAATTTALDPSVQASAAVIQRYRQAAGFDGDERDRNGLDAASQQHPLQRLEPGDECAICQDEMVLPQQGNTSHEKLTFCPSCGKGLHEQCMRLWCNAKRRSGGGGGPTCPYCRCPWDPCIALGGGGALDDESGAVKGSGAGGYLNLADVSDAHRGTDMSMNALYGNERAGWIRRY